MDLYLALLDETSVATKETSVYEFLNENSSSELDFLLLCRYYIHKNEIGEMLYFLRCNRDIMMEFPFTFMFVLSEAYHRVGLYPHAVHCAKLNVDLAREKMKSSSDSMKGTGNDLIETRLMIALAILSLCLKLHKCNDMESSSLWYESLEQFLNWSLVPLSVQKHIKSIYRMMTSSDFISKYSSGEHVEIDNHSDRMNTMVQQEKNILERLMNMKHIYINRSKASSNHNDAKYCNDSIESETNTNEKYGSTLESSSSTRKRRSEYHRLVSTTSYHDTSKNSSSSSSSSLRSTLESNMNLAIKELQTVQNRRHYTVGYDRMFLKDSMVRIIQRTIRRKLGELRQHDLKYCLERLHNITNKIQVAFVKDGQLKHF